jgi:hypothetical protein
MRVSHRRTAFLLLASVWLIVLPGQAQIQSTPATVPLPKAKLPPIVKYSAALVHPNSPVPSRLGGWTCSALACTLRTTGPATQPTLNRMCVALHEAARAQSIKFTVTALMADDEISGKRFKLNNNGLNTCNRR